VRLPSKWIIYEDQDLLAINKPSGITVNRAETTRGKTTVEGLLPPVDLPRRGIVHRIDKDTSGILLVAKNSAALTNLQQQFKDRVVKKTYFALVHGFVEPRSGSVRLPIKRDRYNRKKFSVDITGKPALTEYRTVKNYKGYSLLEIFPKTGRTHQIRVHFKHLGHALVSDRIYGGGKTFKRDLLFCPRLFLHSSKIEFHQPVTQQVISLKTDLPDGLEKTLKKIQFA
jgi:23S rRNA pseudouridine1911/1915/1917 synthase